MEDEIRQKPDVIAHQLVTNVGEPVRIHLLESEATIPVTPCRGGSPDTQTIPVASFEAIVENAEIVDGGMNLFGMNGLHLPASEWQRIGLNRHWEADDADLHSPLFPPERKLEIWASREDSYYHSNDDGQFEASDHLVGLPDDSPVLTTWRENGPADDFDEPPVPLSRPTLSVDAIRAKGGFLTLVG